MHLIFKGSAESLYLPENEKEVAELLRYFNDQKIKATVSGNGTGLTGARVPEGGVIISLEKMNQVLGAKFRKKYIRVQPAVTLKTYKILSNQKIYSIRLIRQKEIVLLVQQSLQTHPVPVRSSMEQQEFHTRAESCFAYRRY